MGFLLLINLVIRKVLLETSLLTCILMPSMYEKVFSLEDILGQDHNIFKAPTSRPYDFHGQVLQQVIR